MHKSDQVHSPVNDAEGRFAVLTPDAAIGNTAAPTGEVRPSHTPGPWSITQRYNALKDEIGVRGRALCTVWTRQAPAIREQGVESAAWPEGEANARLIAAAPEMLAALRWVIALSNANASKKSDGTPDRTPECQDCYDACEAAIAKATGEQA